MTSENFAHAVDIQAHPDRPRFEPPWRRYLRKLLRLMYWALPPVILWIVLRRIDLPRLFELASRADRAGLLVGLCLGPVVVAIGALRWHLLVRGWASPGPGLGWSLGHYWRSLAVGVLAPGSLGMDAYRVVSIGRRTDDYLSPAASVLVEKLLALLACAALATLVWPMLGPGATPPYATTLWSVAVAALVAVGAVGLVTAGFPGSGVPRRLARALRQRAEHAIARITRTAGAVGATLGSGRLPAIFARRHVLAQALLLSMGVYVVSAVQAHVFFVALGEAPPLVVNLLVTPLLFLVLAVPISFGGLGVREVAFIAFYGAFGVPAEAALAVSFCAWASSLLSMALGAGLLLRGPERTEGSSW